MSSVNCLLRLHRNSLSITPSRTTNSRIGPIAPPGSGAQTLLSPSTLLHLLHSEGWFLYSYLGPPPPPSVERACAPRSSGRRWPRRPGWGLDVALRSCCCRRCYHDLWGNSARWCHCDSARVSPESSPPEKQQKHKDVKDNVFTAIFIWQAKQTPKMRVIKGNRQIYTTVYTHTCFIKAYSDFF